MTDFSERLRQKLPELGPADGQLLLAVSGGPDSVALVCAICAIRDQLDFTVTAAHLNHRLRPEADDDADWVAALCSKLGVPLVSGREDVSAVAKTQGQSIEEAARQVRYEFLLKTALDRGCSRIAVAHTADDQAETILHHILRGTGISGLRGMPETRELEPGVLLIRPMLGLTRANVVRFLDDVGQDTRTDSTNADPSFTRSRIRTLLLPLVQREFNPAVTDALLRLGEQAGDVSETMELLASQALGGAIIDANDSACRIDCEKLSSLPRHLVRECFKQIWKQQGWPLQRMGFREWDRLADIVDEGGASSLPHGVDARRRGKLLALQRTT